MFDLRPSVRRIARNTMGFALLFLGMAMPLAPAHSAPTELESSNIRPETVPKSGAAGS